MNNWLVFDIETNGLLPVLSTIHSLCVKDLGTGEHISCAKNSSYKEISYGIERLQKAEKIIGHNIIGFDIPALGKLGYNADILLEKSLDTLNLAALIYPDMLGYDYNRNIPAKTGMPKKMMGANTLKAWGYRVGALKGDFGDTTDWSEWTKEMQDYCEQDVEVTEAVFKYLWGKEPSEKSVLLETEFQKVMSRQQILGTHFNTDKAIELSDDLRNAKNQLVSSIRDVTGDRRIATLFTPKRDNKTKGYAKGASLTKVKYEKFNPNSRPQVAEFLKKEYDWNPVDFTDKGNPKLDSEVLGKLGDAYPLVKDIAQYLDTSKLLSMISGGRYSWLKLVCDGRLHGRVKTNGAITGRCTHSSPNLAQVPSPRAFRGQECRELFTAPIGYKIVGTDVAGLELRNLGHYLYPYDNGAYVAKILEGDIHTYNQEAAGLPTRDTAKTFMYAFIYGAGDSKLGSILVPLGTLGEQKAAGRHLRSLFLSNIKGLGSLLSDIKRAFKRRGYLIGLDGRKLVPRGDHSAPNTLIQSCGAVICKKWVVDTWDMIEKDGLWEVCYPALQVHDEQQIYAPDDNAEQVRDISIAAVRTAEKYFNMRCPLDAKGNIGNNWYETH